MSAHIYAPAQVRALERIAIEELGIPAYELMSRAGRFTFDTARARYPQAHRWLVLCGAGNNAGDGYVVARHAAAAGIKVTVVALADPQQLPVDAARAFSDLRTAGGSVVKFSELLCASADLIVDALLGIGLTRPLQAEYLRVVEAVNAAAAPVIAVDIPTGLHAETGAVLGAAIEANVTTTFIGRKQGLYDGAGPALAGAIAFSSLGVPPERVEQAAPRLRIFDEHDRERALPRRPRHAHKGSFGHVLVIGGNHGMGGAARLAGESALRAGAGLVTVATRAENVALVSGQRPELMCVGIDTPADLERLLKRATVVAIGPGLGQDEWARALFTVARKAPQPLVVDADALNILAGQPGTRASWVLTPHPGEAGRLLGKTTAEIQSARLHAAHELLARYGGIALLKGRGTLVATQAELPYLIDAGNPGMASAGMGDVLTGVVAGLLAQFPGAPFSAVACAAYVHARAADDAAAEGERGLIAGDVQLALRRWLNPQH